MPRSVLFSAMLLVLFGPLGIDLYLPALPVLDTRFDGLGQLSLSLFVLTLGLGQLILGPLSDIWGRRVVGFASLALFSVISFALMFISSATELLYLRTLQGFAASGTVVVAFALVRDYADGDESAKLLSLLNAAINVVPSLAPVLGGIALLHWGWQGPFACLALLPIPCLMFLLIWLREPTNQTEAQSFAMSHFKQLFTHKEFMYFGFMTVTAIIIILSYVSNAPHILIEKEGISTLAFSAYFGFNGFLIICASLLCRPLLHRYGRMKVLHLGLFIMLLGGGLMIALSTQSGPWHFMLPVAVVSVAFALTLGTATSLALSPFAHCAGTATAVLGALQSTNSSILSIAITYLPIPIEVAIGALIMTLSVICLWLYGRCKDKLSPVMVSSTSKL